MAEPVRALEPAGGTQVELGLNAAIVSVRAQQPQILVVSPDTAGAGEFDTLPFGPFSPRAHRTLEIGLRAWVKQQTGLELGYVEQLYTFADRGRHAEPGDTASHITSVGYLALTRGSDEELLGSHWSPWYAYFPWEDWRCGKPEILAAEIEPRLKEWAERTPASDEPMRPLRRAERLRVCFGAGAGFDEERVLERYELLYEAGLVTESSPPPWVGCAASSNTGRWCSSCCPRNSPCSSCKRPWRRSPERSSTSRTSGASSSRAGSSSRPGTCPPGPGGGRPSSIAFAEKLCSSARLRAYESRLAGPDPALTATEIC
jgi:hypothetical protein